VTVASYAAVKSGLLLSDCYKVGKKAELRFRGDRLEGSEEGCDIFRSLFRLQLHNTIVIAAISLLHLFRVQACARYSWPRRVFMMKYLNLVSPIPVLVERYMQLTLPEVVVLKPALGCKIRTSFCSWQYAFFQK
jgi:hypothetical protein